MFGEIIKALRLEKGLSQGQMAEVLGFGNKISTYRAYELEYNQPNIDLLINLSDFFGVSIDYLIGRSNDRGPKKEKYEDIEKIAPALRGRFDTLILELKLRIRFLNENDQSSVLKFYESFGELIDSVFKHGISPEGYGSDDIALLIGSLDEKWLTPIRSRLIQKISDKYIKSVTDGRE